MTTSAGGRRSLLTPVLQTEAVALALGGASRTDIADKLRVGVATFYAWIKRGEAWDGKDETPPVEERPYIDFVIELRAAEAEHRLKHVKRVVAGKDGWKASAWFLERRTPAEYGRRIVKQHTGADGGPIQHEHRGAVIFFPKRNGT